MRFTGSVPLCESPVPLMLNIITVVRNDLIGLKRTIASISSQDRSLIRLVIILDGNSTDGTWEYAQGLDSSFFKTYQSSPKGVYPALNTAMSRLLDSNPPDDDHVLFLNAGDFFLGSRSVITISELTGKRSFTCFATYMLDTRHFPTFEAPKPCLGQGDTYLNPCVFWLPHQGIVASVRLIKEIGTYSTEYEIAADFEWILRLIDFAGPPTLFDNRVVIQMIDGISNKHAYRGYQERIKLAKHRGLKIVALPKILRLKMRMREVASYFGLLKSANKDLFVISPEGKDQLATSSPWRSFFEFTVHPE